MPDPVSALTPEPYTPTLAELREAWLRSEDEERDYTTSDDDLRAEFDRAIAAHDREVAARAKQDAVEWARSCSGESADLTADYIEEMFAMTYDEGGEKA